MINRNLKIAVLVISVAIAGFSVPYLRTVISKNTMDYLSAIGFLVCGIFILIVSSGNGRRIVTGRQGSKLVPISGILLVLFGILILILKVY